VIVRHLRAALTAAEGRIEGPGGAAALLGLDPSTLRHRLRRHRIPFGRAARG
jgi:transcriptional regulator of acetoin/glycerol metabolism